MKQHIRALKRLNTYNTLVANIGIEDFALRPVPSSSRCWSPLLLSGTALGGIAFLALEAIGASLILEFGFANSVLAIAVFMVIGTIMGLPIAYYASRANMDIDLLTRGAGFGYLGSTLTSLVYASYTIIFFAIEGAIMAKALNLSLGLPMNWGYLLSSLCIFPLAFYGITAINQLQKYTQVIWLGLGGLAVGGIILMQPESLKEWTQFAGFGRQDDKLDIMLFGAALSTTFSLLPQIGEQVDYLRFMPSRTGKGWWVAVLCAGPGWAVLGGIKLLCGSYLAVQCVAAGIGSLADASDPVNMYLHAFSVVVGPPWLTIFITTVFVLTCQIKINVTNAYAGSLAWSNFFLRILHAHPGRGVWLIFNVIFAYALMHFGVLQIIKYLLVSYACFAASWIGAIFTDLTILKPLKLSPAEIEYRRAFLYDINPVGFGGMLLGLVVGLCSELGMWGELVEAYAPLVAMLVTIVSATLLAVLTKGKYYLARKNSNRLPEHQEQTCGLCMNKYESNDMLFCPAYREYICSLCCSLDMVCNRICIPGNFVNPLKKYFSRNISRLLLYTGICIFVMLVLFSMCFMYIYMNSETVNPAINTTLLLLFVSVMLIFGIWSWWVVQIQESRSAAENELSNYITQLEHEVTQRKAIAADLTTVSSQQRLILESARIGIAFAENMRLVWSNKRFKSFFEPGISARSGDNLWKILEHTQVDVKNMRKEMHTGLSLQPSTFVTEVQLRQPGKNLWCTFSVSAIDPASPDIGCILLMDDITARKDAEESLRQSQESLQKLNDSLEMEVMKRTEELKSNYEAMHRADKMASLGILISGMAHEVNNPVSFIMLNSGIIQRCLTDLLSLADSCPDDAKKNRIGGMEYEYAFKSIPKLLGGIQDGAERITDIVTNLKNYSRKMPVDLSGKVNLNDALGAALVLLGTFVRQYTDNLLVSKETPLPLFVGDQRQVEQVIINLVQNACQALPDRSRLVSLATKTDGTWVYLTIQDTGVGIPDSDMNHVLDPFFTTKREAGGTGLGLAVASSIVSDHKGQLHIDSKIGIGTTVTLSFPVFIE